jgi:hypothetical protein
VEWNFRYDIYGLAIDMAGLNYARIEWQMKNEVTRVSVRVKGDAPEFRADVFDAEAHGAAGGYRRILEDERLAF